MRKMIITAALSLGLLLSISGCGKNSTDTDAVSVSKSMKKTASLKERQHALRKQIQALTSMGFDVNETKDTKGKTRFLLSVKDPVLVSKAMLLRLNIATWAKGPEKHLDKMLTDAKIGLEVDWKQYAENRDQSVFVYYLGNGKERKAVKKLFSDKKIGAYLSFDAKDRVKQLAFKELDEKIVSGSKMIHLVLKGAKMDITKVPTSTSPQQEMMIHGGTFAYEEEHNGSKIFAFSYQDPLCKISKENAYLGKQNCSFPLVQIDATAGKDSMTVQFKKNSLKYATTLHDSKIKSDLQFNIAEIAIQAKDSGDDLSASLKGFGIEGFSDNMDEALLKEMYALASKPSKDRNQTVTQVITLLGKLFSQGLVFDYKVALASLDGTAVSKRKTTHVTLESYQGEAKASFGKTISYQEQSSIKHILLKEKQTATPLFTLENFTFGYALKDLYNFLPDFMDFALLTAQRADKTAKITKEEQEKLAAIGMKIVHTGFGLSLSPIGMDAVTFMDKGNVQEYGALNLGIDAKLLPNSVKLDKPMSAMLLLSYLQADGKLVLSKSDLEKMYNSFPPQVMAMVMMYAKYEGDKAVFVLKFEKGHLLVNDKPVM